MHEGKIGRPQNEDAHDLVLEELNAKIVLLKNYPQMAEVL
jgi:hypothetical protein